MREALEPASLVGTVRKGGLADPTRMAVVIPTHGRKAALGRLLKYLEQQDRLPDEVVVSVPDPAELAGITEHKFKITVVSGRRGLSAQRNLALEYVLEKFDLVTFFDDDFLPGYDYLGRLEMLFAAHPSWVVITGRVVIDGAKSSPLSFEDGLNALTAACHDRAQREVILDLPGVYGCNMSMRTDAIGTLRFDERLALYGWQEDIDFTNQLRKYGRVVLVNSLLGVHLGAASGRVSGVRLGYSQVMNPVYLIRKGTIGFRYGAGLLLRNFASNMLFSLRPEPHVDRRGRLHGNFLGLIDIVLGRIRPERVVNL